MVTDSAIDGAWFQGKDEDERFQFYWRKHWIWLMMPFLTMLLWSAGLVGASVWLFLTSEMMDRGVRVSIFTTLFFLFTLVQWSFLMKLYVHSLNVTVVTDRKVHRIKKTLFSIDDHQAIDLWTLQDIHRLQHGILQNILGFGSLILESQETQLKIHFIPRVTNIHERLLHLREVARMAMKAQRGQANTPSG